jgi:hypothetical protein
VPTCESSVGLRWKKSETPSSRSTTAASPPARAPPAITPARDTRRGVCIDMRFLGPAWAVFCRSS